jgi:hypothetical protein
MLKFIVWGTFALLAALWTGAAALLAQLVQWSAQHLGAINGTAIDIAGASAALPAWLSPWVDAAAWAEMQQWVVAVSTSAAALAPSLGEIAGWLVPVIWVVWVVGMLLLLGLTVLLALLLRRFQQPPAGGLRAA